MSSFSTLPVPCVPAPFVGLDQVFLWLPSVRGPSRAARENSGLFCEHRLTAGGGATGVRGVEALLSPTRCGRGVREETRADDQWFAPPVPGQDTGGSQDSPLRVLGVFARLWQRLMYVHREKGPRSSQLPRRTRDPGFALW